VIGSILADENTSHRLVATCEQIHSGFPIIHISAWKGGVCRLQSDPSLLMTLREEGMILLSFDRASMAMHAGALTRQGLGHAGVILYRRLVSTLDYGRQARLLVDLMKDAKGWDWEDRIEYLPRR
jgi:hypothetical protein